MESKISISDIEPDKELCQMMNGLVEVLQADGTMATVPFYREGERSTNEAPTDFVEVVINGDFGGISMDTRYASGSLIIALYNKINDDGSIKYNRVKKILEQFDSALDGLQTEHYHYRYDIQRFITPTTIDDTTGYSLTMLNLLWHTLNNF